MKKETELDKLLQYIVDGDAQKSVALSEKLLSSGVSVENIIHNGLTAALQSLDSKCTNEEFNLLELMLAGRAMMAVMDKVIIKYLPQSLAESIPEKTIVIGTIKGDIHELGKHVVKMLFKANGFRIIDLGKDVSPSSFVNTAILERAGCIGVSSLITLTIPYIREIKEILHKTGVDGIKVIAGGAALQQAYPEDLNVDFIAKDAFDALHYLTKEQAQDSSDLRNQSC
ncbi:MAG: cobalamin-dependent protein [Dissulfurispiraceae bacterium]|jgi:methylmalonyl-CoA mutase cobalamin-binding domain/chain|nr:cobalamin-dependent protein [Dissulfurispiraceae bacterium]